MNYLLKIPFWGRFLGFSYKFTPKFQFIQNFKTFFVGVELPETSILEVSTFRRKKTKLKREKRNQRRKKLRRLSAKKKEKKNY